MACVGNKRWIGAFTEILFMTFIFMGLLAVGCAKQASVPKNPEGVSWIQTGGVATTGQYRGVMIADIDGDNHPDIVGASSEPGKVAIWYNDGKGNMTFPQLLPRDDRVDVRSVAAADLNGNGLPDIVASVQRESSGIQVWLNQGNRKWKKGIEPTRINNYEGIRAADVNMDGNMDIIAANSTSDGQGGIQVWLGDGEGNWIIETGPTSVGRYMDAVAADFNGDGLPDIVGAAWGAQGGIHVWLGDGTGNWTAMPPVAVGNFNGLSVIDINNDGNLDLIAGTYRDGVRIFYGDGRGNFTAAPGPTDTGSYWRAVAYGIDDEGATDIIAGSIDGKGIRGWRNIGNNRWKEVAGIFPTLGNYYDFKLADLDHDGRDEVVLAGYGEGIKIISGRAWPHSKTFQDVGGTPGEGDLEVIGDVIENLVFTMKNGYEEYKVGPGDVLEITLWEPDAVTREEVEVMPDGTLSFSFVQDLFINHMTLRQLNDALSERLSAYIRTPRISVRVKFYQSKWAAILGPGRGYHGGGTGGWSGEKGRGGGRYYLDGRVSLIELLSGAGVSQDANLREVMVTRSNGQTLKLNVYKAMTLGDKTQDIIIDHGDSVYISLVSREGNRVFVFGEVAQPGVYAYARADMPMLDAIAAAGGPTVFARLDHAKIIRGDITSPEVISADLRKLIETGDQSQNIRLTDGDLVYVPRTAIGDINIFVKRMSPLLNLISAPLRTYNYMDDLRE